MDEIQKILKNATIDGMTLKLPDEKLERSTYEKVNTVIERLWGKWNTRKKCHIFSYDPTESIAAYVESGVLPPKNELSYFPTPTTVIQDITTMLEHEGRHYSTILEPSAGQGAIAQAIKTLYPNAIYDLVEYSELHANVLRKKGWNPHHQDFLAYKTDTRYDLVVMNPPFNTPGLKNCWIDHLYHAYSLLSTHGSIFCIIPGGWERKNDKKHRQFKEWVSDKINTGFINEQGAFKESGTNIKTHTMRLNSTDESAGFDSNLYLQRFSLAYDGSYGYELYRHNDQNKRKKVDEYVDYIMEEMLTERYFFEALATKYRDQYVECCKESDKEYEEENRLI